MVKVHKIIFGLLGLSLFTTVHADQISWDGGGGINYSWTNAQNWNGSVPGIGDDIIFPNLPKGTFKYRTSLNADYSVATIYLGTSDIGELTASGANSFDTYVLSLTGTAGLPLIDMPQQSVNGAFILGSATATSPYGFLIVSLQTNGAFNIGGSAVPSAYMKATAQITGSRELTKAGVGTLELAPLGTINNWFSGGVRIVAGTVRISKGVDSNLYSPIGTGTLTFNGSGATLEYVGTTPGDFQNNVALPDAGTINISNAAGKVRLFGNISGTQALTKSGPGTLEVINSGNTFSGGLRLNGGSVRIGASSGSTSGPLGTGAITIAGANVVLAPNNSTWRSITNDVTANNNFKLGVAGGGDFTINGTLTLATGATERIVTVDNLKSRFAESVISNGTTTSNTPDFRKAGSGELIVRDIRLLSDAKVDAGKLTIRAGWTEASKVTGIAVATGAKFDLTDNDIAVDYSGTSPVGTFTSGAYTGLTGLIASARNDNSTLWTGDGITTSSAITTAYGLGIAEASQALGLSGTQTTLWRSRTVDATTALIKFTYAGDTNLDGQVNASDLSRLNNGITNGLRGWWNGDFNYDGAINSADTSLYNAGLSAFNANGSLSLAATFDGFELLEASVVPEPTSMSVLMTLFAGALGRRTRMG
jgi:autotransporter-associated beta strand protein